MKISTGSSPLSSPPPPPARVWRVSKERLGRMPSLVCSLLWSTLSTPASKEDSLHRGPVVVWLLQSHDMHDGITCHTHESHMIDEFKQMTSPHGYYGPHEHLVSHDQCGSHMMYHMIHM